MKKIYYLLLLALFGVAGCNNDDSSAIKEDPIEVAINDLNIFVKEHSTFSVEDIPELLCGDKTWMINTVIRYTDESLSEIDHFVYVNWQFENREPSAGYDGGNSPHTKEGCGSVFYKDGSSLQFLDFKSATGIPKFGINGHYEMNWEILPERKAIVWSGTVDHDYTLPLSEEVHNFYGEMYSEWRVLAISANRMVVVQDRAPNYAESLIMKERPFTTVREYIAFDGVKYIEPGELDLEEWGPNVIN